MSSLAPAPTSVPDETNGDPFFYGWRDVVRETADGKRVHEQIPLTREDVLHPQEGDHIVNGTVHDIDRDYIADVARARIANDPHAVAFSDVGVDWDDPILGYHSPDVSVLFGIRERRPAWSMFYTGEEGVKPRVIFEIVSPSTRSVDLKDKFADYHEAGVPFYIIIDRKQPEGPPSILAYQRTPRRYVPLPMDDQGRVWLEPLGIWIGTRDNRVVCYDGATDEELGDYTAISQALAVANRTMTEQRQVIEAEKARADAAKAQADNEKARADEAAHRADQEAHARHAAEARVRELETRLQQARGEPGT